MTDTAAQPPTLAHLRSKRIEILQVAAAHEISNLRVFGSVAPSGSRAGSDIDFVVDLPNHVRGFDAFGVLDEFRQEVETILVCPVDVVTVRGPFSRRGAQMAQSIAREACELPTLKAVVDEELQRE